MFIRSLRTWLFFSLTSPFFPFALARGEINVYYVCVCIISPARALIRSAKPVALFCDESPLRPSRKGHLAWHVSHAKIARLAREASTRCRLPRRGTRSEITLQ
ncbi:hypothetical protein GQ53DRAFT_456003 [Thozetella sp. PMI_491]|nr:hypothetical protein GQ53DRAFT_456003 [Thozetella sp. PMI_491]